MAFLKTCLGTIKKCFVCGKPGIFLVLGKWFCENCKKAPKK